MAIMPFSSSDVLSTPILKIKLPGGASAVVVDAWANKAYKLSDLEANLKDYLGLDYTTGRPELKPFDPQTQGLEVLLGNVCSNWELSDFFHFGRVAMTDRQDELFGDVRRYTELFHMSKDLETKLGAAQTLSKLARQPEIADFPIVKLLRDQIDYLIELNNH